MRFSNTAIHLFLAATGAASKQQSQLSTLRSSDLSTHDGVDRGSQELDRPIDRLLRNQNGGNGSDTITLLIHRENSSPKTYCDPSLEMQGPDADIGVLGACGPSEFCFESKDGDLGGICVRVQPREIVSGCP